MISALTSALIVFPFHPAPTISSFVASGKTLIDLEYALGTFVLTCTQLPDTPSALFVNRLPLPAKLTITVPELPPTEDHATYGEPAPAAVPSFATSGCPVLLRKLKGLSAIL